MTQSKAASVASALTTAGYFARTAVLGDGTWVVFATASAPTTVDAVKTFQDAQAITGKVTETIFS